MPGESEALTLFGRLVHEAWSWGWRHGRQEVSSFPVEASSFNLQPEANAPVPVDAVAWMRTRQALLGKWSRDLDAAVTRILAQAIETGATLDETVKALRSEVFPDFGKSRLETIARTETTAAYNKGRLHVFQEPTSQVGGVQFAAILDANTTQICRHRDGLILRMDDERLQANTPPLHFNCRSVLIPLSHRDLRRLAEGHEPTIDRLFGWVENGPKSLDDALRGWLSAAPAQKGFGAL